MIFLKEYTLEANLQSCRLIWVNSKGGRMMYSRVMKIDNQPKNLTGKELKDLRLLALFIDCWCGAHHDNATRTAIASVAEFAPLTLSGCRLCPECRELLDYAIARRRVCPLNPKPACKDCPIHCYQAEQRAKIRNIMRFSGRHLILRGRLDLLWHYYF
jgi:hypothetical protein